MSLNDELRDRAVRHALELERFSRGLSDTIVRLLNDDDADLLDKLAAGLAGIEGRGIDLSPSDRKKLAGLRSDLAGLNSATYATVVARLTEELNSLATVEADFQKRSLDKALGTVELTQAPSASRLASILDTVPIDGHLFTSWTDQAEQGRIDRINQAITKGLRDAKSTDDIVRSIRGTKAGGYADGVLSISRNGAQSLVRTAVTGIANVAAQRTWQANSDVVAQWQFLATLDTRTTLTCAGLDGKTFPLGEGPIPPLHIRCRSITVAVTKSFRELGVDADEIPRGTRASMDGQVAGGTTFQSWLKRKDAAAQDKVLGKTRAGLFRAGKLDLDQFIKNDGQVLTLDQLKKAHGDILG